MRRTWWPRRRRLSARADARCQSPQRAATFARGRGDGDGEPLAAEASGGATRRTRAPDGRWRRPRPAGVDRGAELRRVRPAGGPRSGRSAPRRPSAAGSQASGELHHGGVEVIDRSASPPAAVATSSIATERLHPRVDLGRDGGWSRVRTGTDGLVDGDARVIDAHGEPGRPHESVVGSRLGLDVSGGRARGPSRPPTSSGRAQHRREPPGIDGSLLGSATATRSGRGVDGVRDRLSDAGTRS